MRQLRSACFYGVYLVLAVGALLVLIEAILGFVFVLTGKSALDTLVEKDRHPYPENPADYIKISIFGSSAAAGWAAERSFAEIIDYELPKTYPNFKFFIKNYAQNGATFHRQQAEILKNVIDKYDIFLVYAGNNECLSYLRDNAHNAIRGGESQSWWWLLSPPDPDTDSAWRKLLEHHSRLYALCYRISRRYVFSSLIKAEFIRSITDRKSSMRRFRLFEDMPAVPWEERTKIIGDFENDLEEIAKLIAGKGKYLIVSNVPTNENYKPLFSVVSPALSPDEHDLFFKHYYQGLEQFGRGELQATMEFFRQANLIDNNVAIVKYMIGQTHLSLGNSKEGRMYLENSIDLDGYVARALTGLWTAAKRTARNYENVRYVDSVEAFHAALDNGAEYNELFSDLNHPSLMGHIIIGSRFMDEIARLPFLQEFAKKQDRREWSLAELRSSLRRCREALAVTDQDESMTALRISRVHLDYSLSFANSDDYWPTAQTNILKFYEKSSKTREAHAKMLLFLALIDIERENLTEAVGYANEALRLSSFTVWNVLAEPLICGELPVNIFKRARIFYDESDNKFVVH